MKLYKYVVKNAMGADLKPILLGYKDDQAAAAKLEHKYKGRAIFLHLQPVGLVEVGK